MAHHKKLADEALANDYVIHQNACADRKLQKQLDHLERMQTKQRRKLEQEEHYFTVLHRVVPVFNPVDETMSQISGVRPKPELRRRVTEPLMAVKSARSERFSPRMKSRDFRDIPSPHTQTGILNLKDIAYDAPYRDRASTECKQKSSELGLARRHTSVCDSHLRRDTYISDHKESRKPHSHAEKDLMVTGNQLGERRQHRVHQSIKGSVSARTKCMQYVHENESYLHDIESMSLKKFESGDEEDNRSMESNNSNASDSSLIEEEKLPNIDKVGLRLMGYNPSTQKMKMLYQLKEGKLDVPGRDLLTRDQTPFENEADLVGLEKLNLRSRNLRKSLSNETRHRSTPVEMMRSDPQLINVAHMTLVKFLPKSKQAFYLKYDCGLRKSWHAGDNI